MPNCIISVYLIRDIVDHVIKLLFNWYIGINAPVFKAMEPTEMNVSEAALKTILLIVQQIKEGSISKQCLEMILKHTTNMDRLVKSSHLELNLTVYAERLVKLKEHSRAVRLIFHGICDAVQGKNLLYENECHDSNSHSSYNPLHRVHKY